MMCEGSMAAIMPTVTIRKFGHIRGHDVFAFIYSSYGVSALLGSFLVAHLQNTIGFEGMVYIGAGLALLSMYITYIIDDQHTFNYAQFSKVDFETYGETFTNKYGLQVRNMGV